MNGTTQSWTAKQLARALGVGRRSELVRGTLVEVPHHDLHSARVVGRLIAALDSLREAHWIFVGAGFKLEAEPDTVLAPPLSVVRKARLAGLDLIDYPCLAPDLAIDVPASSDAASHFLQKLEIYENHGMNAWVVDARYQRAEIRRPRLRPVRLGLDDALEDADLLPGLRIPLSDLFPRD